MSRSTNAALTRRRSPVTSTFVPSNDTIGRTRITMDTIRITQNSDIGMSVDMRSHTSTMMRRTDATRPTRNFRESFIGP